MCFQKELTMRPSQGPSAPTATTEQGRQVAWERGNADYLGQDSWENIRKHLDQQMS